MTRTLVIIQVLCMSAVLFFLSVGLLSAETLNPSADKVSRQRWAVAAIPDQYGTRIDYQNFAAYPWHPSTVTPDRVDGGIDPVTGAAIPGWPINPNTGKPVLKWPIIADYTTGPTIVWYWNKSFRSSNGSAWGKPPRWAYVRMVEEQWNSSTKQFDVPGLGPVPVATPTTPITKAGVHIDDIAGQQMVDILKRSFTSSRIKDFIDASPYNEPDTGAPLVPKPNTP